MDKFFNLFENESQLNDDKTRLDNLKTYLSLTEDDLGIYYKSFTTHPPRCR